MPGWWSLSFSDKSISEVPLSPPCVLQTNLEHDVYERLTTLQEGIIPKKKAATDDDLHRINELIQVGVSSSFLLTRLLLPFSPPATPLFIKSLFTSACITKKHSNIFCVKASKCLSPRMETFFKAEAPHDD